MKLEAHRVAGPVCRKGSFLWLLPVAGACYLLSLSLAQAATSPLNNTTLSDVITWVDAIDCGAAFETLDEETRQLTDDSTGSPFGCLIGPGPAVDKADHTSRYDQSPLHLAANTFHAVPQPPPRVVVGLGGIAFSLVRHLPELRERGPPIAA